MPSRFLSINISLNSRVNRMELLLTNDVYLFSSKIFTSSLVNACPLIKTSFVTDYYTPMERKIRFPAAGSGQQSWKDDPQLAGVARSVSTIRDLL